jgi:hypothetical protein
MVEIINLLLPEYHKIAAMCQSETFKNFTQIAAAIQKAVVQLKSQRQSVSGVHWSIGLGGLRFLLLPANAEAVCLQTGSALPTAAIVDTYQFDFLRSGQDRRERVRLTHLMPT